MQATTSTHRRIGKLEVSLSGLGCNNFGWRIDEAQTQRVVDAALEAGINFFDTADIYDKGHSEEYLGRALLGNRRSQVVIATKFGMKFDETRSGARPESPPSRRGQPATAWHRLHRSVPNPSARSGTPIADTLGALEELKSAGKVREIGCSNFNVAQLHEAGGKFVSLQNQYSLFHREPEAEVLPCMRGGQASRSCPISR